MKIEISTDKSSATIDGVEYTRKGKKISEWLQELPDGYRELALANFKGQKIKYYNGIAIELKVKGGKLSDKQIEFIDQLEKSNWLCIVAFNLDSLMEYFKINIRR